MNILVVDTSSKEIAIGLFKGDKCLYENYIVADKNYNKVLMPIIQESIKKAGLVLGDIDIFASTLGPGSFTGIRVGMAALKGLAQPVRKKYTGDVVLDILANSSASQKRVWAILDAGRNELYAAVYNTKDSVKAISGRHMLLTREQFMAKQKKGDTIISLSRENLAGTAVKSGAGVTEEVIAHVDMKVFAAMTARKAKSLKSTDLYTAAPVYIRPSEAEVTLKRKNKERKIMKRGGTK